MNVSDILKGLLRDTSGATAIEYGLILALIFLAMVGAFQALGENTIIMWMFVATEALNASK